MADICHLTSSHRSLDNRIFYSELFTLNNYGFNCSVIGIHSKRCEKYHGINIIGITSDSEKATYFLKQPILILFKALLSPVEIYHFHDPALIPMAVILKFLRKQIIYDVHDDYEASVQDRLRRWPVLARIVSKLWWFFEKCASCFFDGIVVADRHLSKKFAWKKPIVLGNYPRIDFTTPADTSKKSTFNIIFVGGVNEARGVGKVIDAINILPYEDLRFNIIGECRDSRLVDKIKRNARVRYFGRVAWTELHRFYQKAHVGVALYQPLASYIYYPGENSVKIIEYMAAGIPVICSNFPGLIEFVEKPGYGITVRPDDPEEIAKKIRRLYENPAIRIALGQKGRQAFEAEYNWEKQEGRLIALYESILSKKAGDIPSIVH